MRVRTPATAGESLAHPGAPSSVRLGGTVLATITLGGVAGRTAVSGAGTALARWQKEDAGPASRGPAQHPAFRRSRAMSSVRSATGRVRWRSSSMSSSRGRFAAFAKLHVRSAVLCVMSTPGISTRPSV